MNKFCDDCHHGHFDRCGGYCGCGSPHGYCTCDPTNTSNRTMVIPVAGASWVDDYKEYHPEDTRTPQEILDSQIWIPAEYAPNSTPTIPAEYSQEVIQDLLDELRTVKQSLIDANLMKDN